MESASVVVHLSNAVVGLRNEVADLSTTVRRLRRQNVTLFVSVVALTISVLGLWCRP